MWSGYVSSSSDSDSPDPNTGTQRRQYRTIPAPAPAPPAPIKGSLWQPPLSLIGPKWGKKGQQARKRRRAAATSPFTSAGKQHSSLWKALTRMAPLHIRTRLRIDDEEEEPILRIFVEGRTKKAAAADDDADADADDGMEELTALMGIVALGDGGGQQVPPESKDLDALLQLDGVRSVRLVVSFSRDIEQLLHYTQGRRGVNEVFDQSAFVDSVQGFGDFMKLLLEHLSTQLELNFFSTATILGSGKEEEEELDPDRFGTFEKPRFTSSGEKLSRNTRRKRRKRKTGGLTVEIMENSADRLTGLTRQSIVAGLLRSVTVEVLSGVDVNLDTLIVHGDTPEFAIRRRIAWREWQQGQEVLVGDVVYEEGRNHLTEDQDDSHFWYSFGRATEAYLQSEETLKMKLVNDRYLENWATVITSNGELAEMSSSLHFAKTLFQLSGQVREATFYTSDAFLGRHFRNLVEEFILSALEPGIDPIGEEDEEKQWAWLAIRHMDPREVHRLVKLTQRFQKIESFSLTWSEKQAGWHIEEKQTTRSRIYWIARTMRAFLSMVTGVPWVGLVGGIGQDELRQVRTSIEHFQPEHQGKYISKLLWRYENSRSMTMYQ